jgi:excisionase family DNA binding protein
MENNNELVPLSSDEYDAAFFDNLIMDTKEASRFLKLCTKTVYRLAHEGDIPCKRVGRSYRFHQASLEEWVKKGF